MHGHDLGDPGVEGRASLRECFPDHEVCGHKHPKPLEERTPGHYHANFQCDGQKWRQAMASGALQLPHQRSLPQPVAPPRHVAPLAAPVMPSINFHDSQVALIVDPSAARDGLAMLVQPKKK